MSHVSAGDCLRQREPCVGALRSGLIPELPEPQHVGADSAFTPVSAGIAGSLKPGSPTKMSFSFVIFCQVLSVLGLSKG